MSKRFGNGHFDLRGFGLAVIWLCGLISVQAADSLVWHKQTKTVDAQIESADFPTILKKLSAETGWKVYVEPGTSERISVKFKNLAMGEALTRLLSPLNFALLPQADAPGKFFVFRTSLQEATQLVEGEAGPDRPKGRGPIPNELVITMRSGAKQKIDALARALKAKVVGKVDGLNAFRLRFADPESTQAARDALSGNEDVAATDSNFPVDQPTRVDNVELSSPSSFAIQPKLGNPGSQTIVALIDTPVQPLDGKMNDFLLPSLHVAGDPSLPLDQLTHGTSMAETILHGLRYAPEEKGGSSVRVLPVDVYGNSPETTTFDVAKGIYAAMGAGATVINLSLGGDGDSPFLAGLIHSAHQQGVLFFAAAGNQPTTDPTYPAAYPDVVAVTAGDRKGNIAEYANRGAFVDVIAPGMSLVDYQGQSYMVRGTSAATAYVSGTAAGYRANGSPGQTVEQYIRQTLAVKPGP